MTVAPIPSASLLVIRDGDDGLEVLMQERPKTMAFAAGAYVFPGGKVDNADKDQAWETITGEPITFEQLFKIAAFRELYEETGILLTDASKTKAKRDGSAADFRDALLSEKQEVDLSSFVPFAHWITPEISPRRYDTMFYLVPCPKDQDFGTDGRETMRTVWVRPRVTLDAWKSDDIPLMFPTRLNLMKLNQSDSVEEAIEHAQNTPIFRVLPKLDTVDGVRTVTIPEEAGFGVSEASQRELRVEASLNLKKS